jgi:hypothetical protein
MLQMKSVTNSISVITFQNIGNFPARYPTLNLDPPARIGVGLEITLLPWWANVSATSHYFVEHSPERPSIPTIWPALQRAL